MLPVYAQQGLTMFGVTKLCTNGMIQKLSAICDYSNNELKLFVPFPPPVALAQRVPLMSARKLDAFAITSIGFSDVNTCSTSVLKYSMFLGTYVLCSSVVSDAFVFLQCLTSGLYT